MAKESYNLFYRETKKGVVVNLISKGNYEVVSFSSWKVRFYVCEKCILVVESSKKSINVEFPSKREAIWMFNRIAKLVEQHSTPSVEAASSASSSTSVDELVTTMGELKIDEHWSIKPSDLIDVGSIGVKDFCSNTFSKWKKTFCRTDSRHAEETFFKRIDIASGTLEKNTDAHEICSFIHAFVSTVVNALPTTYAATGVSVSQEFKVFATLDLNNSRVSLSGRIDYLGVDPKTNRLVVIEYKSATSQKFVNMGYLVVPDIAQARIYALMVRKMFNLSYTPDCYLLKFSVEMEVVDNKKSRTIGLWKLKNTENITTLANAVDVPLL